MQVRTLRTSACLAPLKVARHFAEAATIQAAAEEEVAKLVKDKTENALRWVLVAILWVCWSAQRHVRHGSSISAASVMRLLTTCKQLGLRFNGSSKTKDPS